MNEIFEYKRQLLTRTTWKAPQDVDSWIKQRFERLAIADRTVTYWLVEGVGGRVLGIYHGKAELKEIK